jgi:hypothetical protein
LPNLDLFIVDFEGYHGVIEKMSGMLFGEVTNSQKKSIENVDKIIENLGVDKIIDIANNHKEKIFIKNERQIRQKQVRQKSHN